MQIDSLTQNSNGSDSLAAIKSDIDSLGLKVSSVFVNVKDYGAVGDSATDDTVAINAAFAVANGQDFPGIVYFPDGTYSVDPTTLSVVECHIFGPAAELRAINTSTDGVLKLGYTTGVNITLSAILGYDTTEGGSRYGVGLTALGTVGEFPGESDINIGEIRGFSYGIMFDNTPGFHIGTNRIHIGTIWYCTNGIYFGGGDAGGLQVENMRIHVTYMVFCATSIALMSNGVAPVIQNIIEIDCLELHRIAHSIGIEVGGASTEQNIIRINSIYYDSNTDYIVISSDGFSKNNLYEIPDADMAKISIVNDILRMDTNAIGIVYGTRRGRSVVYGPSPAPVSGYWSVGDRYIINNPTAGGVASYCYTAGGWKAETTLAA
jgi:hypothetical protein